MGEWQKLFVGILVDLGLSHDMAMLVMGKTCDLRQKAYMQGYDRGWAAALNQCKPTAQPTTTAAQNLPLDCIGTHQETAFFAHCLLCGAKTGSFWKLVERLTHGIGVLRMWKLPNSQTTRKVRK